MFKASENATEGTGLSYLDAPYLGPAKLKDVSLEEINNTPNTIKFVFGDLEGTDYRGNNVSSSTTLEHVEWGVDSSTSDEDIQKKVDRIAYIAGRFAPKDRVQSIEATDWVGYCEAIIQLLNQHNYQQKQVYIKAVGNVWQGNARVKFPGYRDFIAEEEGELSWSSSERQQNEEYYEALNSSPSPAGEDEVVDNVEDAEF